jgi:iron complex outermembrane receptor protein
VYGSCVPHGAAILLMGIMGAGAITAVAYAQDAAPASPASPPYNEVVDVVGVTPIEGLGVPKSLIPANVQTLTPADLKRPDTATATEGLTAHLASVHLNEVQANPFQPDIQFRGFTASPLLGVPQGLAVYEDGVRVNEPFGDSVNWDAIPENAIAGITLMPGSNPLFGLNALGGALSVQTKTGFSDPGYAAQFSDGSFGRRWLDLAGGAHTDHLAYFVTGRLMHEDGWREFSPSSVRQLFGAFNWQGTASSAGATVTIADNRLVGNGPLPIQLLEVNRRTVFTHSDITENRLAQIAGRGSRVLGRFVVLNATLFYRPSRIRTTNGDDTTYDACSDPGDVALMCADNGDGSPVRDPSGVPVPADPVHPLDGTINTSLTDSRGWGGGVQLTATHAIAGRTNQFIAGTSLEGAVSNYDADTELARLTETRGTDGSGFFDADAAVRLRAKTAHAGLYAADFLSITQRLGVMATARYNHSTLRLRDLDGMALTGDHTFVRVNPSVGVTFAPMPRLTLYGSYSMASRVPTPSELGCADPANPCRLPNGFVADPPLDQVVAHTWEGGARGGAGAVTWSAAVFRTRNRNDILFASSGALTNQGHFANVGDTERAGIELAVAGGRKAIRWSAAYTYLEATFASALILSSTNHPDAVEGEIAVAAGAMMPSIPKHRLKASLDWSVGRTTIDLDAAWTSSQYLRGDEANLLPPIDGYSTVGLSVAHRLAAHINVTARVTNLLGTNYTTFGLLGQAADVLGPGYDDPRFLSPGEPRAAWGGIALSFR